MWLNFYERDGSRLDLKNYVDGQKDNMLKTLSEVVRINSVRGEEKADAPFGEGPKKCLNFVLEKAKELGFKTKNMDNYMGWAELGEGSEMIAVMGHLDVVPEGSGWDKDPFSGQVENGNIYGRGTMDDKGPTVACLYALKAIKESGLPLKRRIRILFGTNEETGSDDMKYYRENGGEIPFCGFTPDGEYPVINGEKGIINATFKKDLDQKSDLILKKISGGTAFNVVPAHAKAEFTCQEFLKKEILADKKFSEKIKIEETKEGFIVEAKGLEAHASTPEKGNNAIGNLLIAIKDFPMDKELKKAVVFLAEKIGLETFGQSLGIDIYDDNSGKLSLNMGVIEGNENFLEVKLNYRYPVTRSYDECAPILDKQFDQVGFKKIFEKHKNSLFVDENTEFIKILLDVYKEHTNFKPHTKSIGGGTYAKALPNIVAFGPIFPGDEIREHLPNEYWEVEKIFLNMEIYADAMYRLANM